jgi:hypothetical protein
VTDGNDKASEALMNASAGNRLALIAESFVRLTNRRLIDAEPPMPHDLWTAPRVILAHGTEADPIFFYGNRMALDLFEIDAADFLKMPSRLSAEPLGRDERARLLDRVSRDGFIADYAGVRISAKGRRFRIEQAVVWNLVNGAGAIRGQAATFDSWVPVAD